jgi:hypothetical protein
VKGVKDLYPLLDSVIMLLHCYLLPVHVTDGVKRLYPLLDIVILLL